MYSKLAFNAQIRANYRIFNLEMDGSAFLEFWIRQWIGLFMCKVGRTQLSLSHAVRSYRCKR